MYNLAVATWIRLAIWLVIGMFIYFGYSTKHSRVQRGAVAVTVPPGASR
jgi:APA family basic amino acid/polyamine antiporter